MSKIIISLLSLFFFLALSIIKSFSIYETISLLVLSVPLIVYIRGGKKERSIIIGISLALSVSLSLTQSLLFDNAAVAPSIIKAVSSLIYIVPLIILIDEDKRKVYLTLSFILSLLLYLPYSETINSYYYLYSNIEDYSKFLLYSKIIIFLLIALPVEELIINRKRNYLTLIILFTVSILSFLNHNITYASLYFLILLIYMYRKKEDIKIEEKKKITLSRMETVKMEKLHKKKKEKVYEIPPNLPIDDRAQNKDE